ncbi:MAG TPA: FAD:protein FMN transferase [Tepidiformaceae bacterium]|nr:FAD:protein FMN transferase [Tepidiformaceae bacterium]
MEHALSFRAMDTAVDVLALAPSRPGVLDQVPAIFEDAEQRFSRFRPASLLSRLNRGETIDDPAFASLCRLALSAFEFTGGLFNPMILPALARAGYDQTFASITGGELRPALVPDPRDCLEIRGGHVALREGQLDLGGIAKGMTVDQAVETVATSVGPFIVNAGGDLRTHGDEPGGRGWEMVIEHPTAPVSVWQGRVSGALATSTTARRRWTTPSGLAAHHLIDPRTGLPAESPFVQVSVFAENCWVAEVWAKAVLVGASPTASLAAAAGNTILAVDQSGGLHEWSPPAREVTG